jgi:uncharacterized delta-60 repeat protein
MRRSILPGVGLVLTLAAGHTAFAAPGDLDAGFSGDGYQVFPFPSGTYDSAYDVLILENDEVVAGGISQAAGTNRFGLLRTTPGGGLDESFSDDGYLIDSFDPAGHDVPNVLLHQDGKYIAAGWSDKGEGRRITLARYDSNGDRTTGFGNEGVRFTSVGPGDELVYGGAMSGGKIVLAGRHEEDEDADGFVVRYTAGGDLDDTFSKDGIRRFALGSSVAFDALAVQDDRKIVAAGTSTKNGVTALTLVRFLPNGSLDDSFSGDGSIRVPFADAAGASAVVITPSGKIVAAGWAELAMDEYKAPVVRVRPNGALDDTFSDDGKALVTYGTDPQSLADDLVLQPDGKLVLLGAHIAADYVDSDVGAARIRSNGSLDDTFSGDGRRTFDFEGWDFATAGELQSDGRLIFVGGSESDFLVGAIDTGL